MKKGRIPLTTLAVVILASAFWIALGSLVIDYAQHQDFLSFYLGGLTARKAGFSHLYDVDLIAQLQLGLLGAHRNVVPFTRPPVYALLIAPLTLLPLAPAFWVWVSAQVGALLACWRWLALRFGYDALIFAALYFPTSVGIYNGQDPIWMLAIFLGSYALLERERELAAGAALGLGLIKFHLLFLIPAAMILDRRWRMLAGFCATGAALAGASILLGGPGIVGAYYTLLLGRHDLPTMAPPDELMIGVRSLAWNLGVHSPLVTGPLIVLPVLLAGIAAWRAPLWRWFSAASIGTLLVAPHVYRYDAGILLLPLLLAIYQSPSRFTRIVAATAAIPIPYMAAFFGPPYSGLPALLLVALLGALARENVNQGAALRASLRLAAVELGAGLL